MLRVYKRINYKLISFSRYEEVKFAIFLVFFIVLKQIKNIDK